MKRRLTAILWALVLIAAALAIFNIGYDYPLREALKDLIGIVAIAGAATVLIWFIPARRP